MATRLAPFIDAKREQEGQSYDLAPEHIRVRFDHPPFEPEKLPAQPFQHWPSWQLEMAVLDPAAPGTPPDPHPARPLGALVYELLAGQPPTAEVFQPAVLVNERVNALLRQVLEGADSFGTAVHFAEAFRLAQAGEFHVPVKAVETVSAWEQDTREHAPVGSLLTSDVRQAWRFPWRGLGIAAVLLASVAAGWWFMGRGGKESAGWSLAQVPTYLHRRRPRPPPR